MKGPPTASVDLTFDWKSEDNEIDEDLEPVPADRLRADSLPPGLEDIPLSAGPGKLKNIEENPYLFVLEADKGRSHTFELALCGSTTFAPHGDPTVSAPQDIANRRTRKKPLSITTE